MISRLQNYDNISKVVSVVYGKDTNGIKLETATNQGITKKRTLQPMEKILWGYGKKGKKTSGNSQYYHQNLCRTVYSDGCFHIFGGEGTIVCADVGFIEKFAEVVVGTAEAAIEDGGKGGFWIAAVGRGVVASEFADEL